MQDAAVNFVQAKGSPSGAVIVTETTKVAVIPAKVSHVVPFLSDIRREDRHEWVAFTGMPTQAALQWSIENSLVSRCTILKREGIALSLYGVHELGADYGGEKKGAKVLWFAAANLGYSHLPQFAFISQLAFAELHSHFDRLVAWVDARNMLHLKYLAWMDFETIDFHPKLGPFDLPFYRVQRITQ